MWESEPTEIWKWHWTSLPLTSLRLEWGLLWVQWAQVDRRLASQAPNSMPNPIQQISEFACSYHIRYNDSVTPGKCPSVTWIRGVTSSFRKTCKILHRVRRRPPRHIAAWWPHKSKIWPFTCGSGSVFDSKYMPEHSCFVDCALFRSSLFRKLICLATIIHV